MGKVFVTVSLSCLPWDDFRLLLFESFFSPILISVKILFEVVYFSTHRVRIEIMSIFESKGIYTCIELMEDSNGGASIFR